METSLYDLQPGETEVTLLNDDNEIVAIKRASEIVNNYLYVHFEGVVYKVWHHHSVQHPFAPAFYRYAGLVDVDHIFFL